MAAADVATSARSTGFGALASLAGAAAASAGHVPLPWLLGPLLAVATLHLSGRALPAPEALRSAGQLVVGAAIGLAFVPAVALLALSLWPLVLANAALATATGIGGAWLLHRTTGVDLRTCYLSAAIGGASDMQALAERFGADPDLVAAAHVVRISLVVLGVPLAFALLAGDAQAAPADAASFSLSGFTALLAVAGLAGALAFRAAVPNAWGIAPLLAACACALSGLEFGAVPTHVVHAGQLVIGWSLGSRFSAGFFRHRQRFFLAVAGYSVAAVLTTTLVAGVLGGAAAQSVPSVVLGAAPGGLAEMSLTARLFGLDVALVTSLQLTRVIVAAVLTAPLLTFLQRTLTRRAGSGESAS